MTRECGLSRSQDDETKPLILRMVEKVRIGDFGNSAQKNSHQGSEEISHSPQQMRPAFSGNNDDHTPPTTGIHGSQENENSRKNTMNHKQKQSKSKPSKGAPYGEDSNSSDKNQKRKSNDMTSLNDLPGLGKQKQQLDRDYDFGGFEDFEDGSEKKNGNSRYSNAERYLDDYENEQKEGFKVEVRRPS